MGDAFVLRALFMLDISLCKVINIDVSHQIIVIINWTYLLTSLHSVAYY